MSHYSHYRQSISLFFITKTILLDFCSDVDQSKWNRTLASDSSSALFYLQATTVLMNNGIGRISMIFWVDMHKFCLVFLFNSLIYQKFTGFSVPGNVRVVFVHSNI